MTDFAAIVGFIVVLMVLIAVLLFVAWVVEQNTDSTAKGSIVAATLGLVAFALIFDWIFYSDRPYILTRFSAAHAIVSTAQFQHKTKLRFEIGQFEGIFPGVCHNFEFSEGKTATVGRYLKSGALQFSEYRNQTPPFPPPSTGSIDLSLSSVGFLSDRIEPCKARDVTAATGAYELALGNPVVEVTGIRLEGNRGFVDFNWHFESLKKLGQELPRIQITKDFETRDERVSQTARKVAPFWIGRAELVKYDDGWRVVMVELQGSQLFGRNWDYGPEWPDPNFNWHTFDEDENHF